LPTLIFIIVICSFSGQAQIPNPALVGYFHNWNISGAPYIDLDQIDSRYNIIEVAFATPQVGTYYDMEFAPSQVSQSQFISQIQTIQNQGKKVLISIGGATAYVKLNNLTERDTFISTMNNIINTYGFDGIDIDLEGSSIYVTGGTINSPIDAHLINLIDAIKQIMLDYHILNGKKLLLTMAPETAYVQGGQSAFGSIWGAYLPVIHALRDSIDILQVQLYNTGSMLGIDGNLYGQSTGDFIVAMTEAVIQGFNTQGGQFTGLPASKVAVALPACPSAAGGGYTNSNVVENAINYLMGNGTQVGAYSLQNSAGYPDLAGMMTWSVNWDAASNCGGSYQYAQIFDNIFGGTVGSNEMGIDNIKIYPNPAEDIVNVLTNNTCEKTYVEIINLDGKILFMQAYNFQSEIALDISSLQKGVFCLRISTDYEINQFKLIKY
jgi:chitinase